MKTEFIAFFKQIHSQIVPIPESDLRAYAKTHKVGCEVVIDPVSLLPKNICAAPNCSFFLKKHPQRFSHHLDVWGSKLPKGFHALVKTNHSKSKEEIFEIFVKANTSSVKVEDGNPVKADFGRTDEEILEYIENLRGSYAKISIN